MDLQDLDIHLQSIKAVTTSGSLRRVMIQTLQALGFESWVYASDNPYSTLAMPATLASGQTTRWLMKYLVKGYQEIDPIVIHCRNENVPFFWDSKVGWEDADPKVQKFMMDVSKHGFGSGLALPLKQQGAPNGMLSLTSKQSMDVEYKRYEQLLPCLTRIGATAHEVMHQILKQTKLSQ